MPGTPATTIEYRWRDGLRQRLADAVASRFPGEKAYRMTGAGAKPYVLFYDPIRGSREAECMTGLTEFSFREDRASRMVTMSATINGRAYELPVPIDGTRTSVRIPEMLYASEAMLSSHWEGEDTFVVRFRWYETCFTKELAFTFDGERCVVDERMVHGDDPDLATGLLAEALLQ